MTEYLIDLDFRNTSEAERVCQVVLRVVLSRVEMAFMDAYSDVVDLPAPAEVAQAALFRLLSSRSPSLRREGARLPLGLWGRVRVRGWPRPRLPLAGSSGPSLWSRPSGAAVGDADALRGPLLGQG